MISTPRLAWLGAFALTLSGTGCGGGTSGGDDAVDGGEDAVDGPLRPGDPVTILTWNLNEFFDTFDDPSSPEIVDALSPQDYADRVAGAAAILAELDPDVVVLQEVEGEVILQALDDALEGAYPEQQLLPGHDARGLDVAALSKLPFTAVESHQDDIFVVEGTVAPEYDYARDCVEYHVTIGEQAVVLLAVHFRDNELDDPDRRLAEAQHTRTIADALVATAPARAVLVVGDYSDLPGSPPLEAVVGAAPVFTSAADHVTQESRWTVDVEGSRQLVDHQLGNPAMMLGLDPSSVRIRHGADVDAVSDHAPLVATYYLE